MNDNPRLPNRSEITQGAIIDSDLDRILTQWAASYEADSTELQYLQAQIVNALHEPSVVPPPTPFSFSRRLVELALAFLLGVGSTWLVWRPSSPSVDPISNTNQALVRSLQQTIPQLVERQQALLAHFESTFPREFGSIADSPTGTQLQLVAPGQPRGDSAIAIHTVFYVRSSHGTPWRIAWQGDVMSLVDQPIHNPFGSTTNSVDATSPMSVAELWTHTLPDGLVYVESVISAPSDPAKPFQRTAALLQQNQPQLVAQFAESERQYQVYQVAASYPHLGPHHE